ncbi:helix-turn-helix domain-containing protein [Flagellimonas sediminis]|uniref:DNA-binding protein n=1 Tax=Flagellimonas sediminis TaxID=2696468 RepID=A0A6I5L010_9FLAO|nr:helix-turn-helix domain-containing protein [Allomuricauda sediminis]NDV43101.1 DNA-binding protein [Allomuricauda sediminis]
MGATIITTEDLQEFKKELLEDIQKLLKERHDTISRKWIKSGEVRELLGIAPGTLQNLRLNGTLTYSKIGGLLYYDHVQIMELLDENTVNRDSR